jgi:mediator of RNA polymerase II transcription subunit 16
MEHTFGSSGGLYDESMQHLSLHHRIHSYPAFTGKFSAAIAALTLAFSRGSGSDANTDDILMIVLGQLSPGKLWKIP